MQRPVRDDHQPLGTAQQMRCRRQQPGAELLGVVANAGDRAGRAQQETEARHRSAQLRFAHRQRMDPQATLFPGEGEEVAALLADRVRQQDGAGIEQPPGRLQVERLRVAPGGQPRRARPDVCLDVLAPGSGLLEPPAKLPFERGICRARASEASEGPVVLGDRRASLGFQPGRQAVMELRVELGQPGSKSPCARVLEDFEGPLGVTRLDQEIDGLTVHPGVLPDVLERISYEPPRWRSWEASAARARS